MDHLSWWYSAQTFAVIKVNGKMYEIIKTGQITIPERASLTSFSLKTPVVGSHKIHVSMHNATVSHILPAAGSIPYDDTSTSRVRAHDIISLDVRIQEEYLNFHARYLAANTDISQGTSTKSWLTGANWIRKCWIK